MGFWDSFTDLVEAATPWSTAAAEAPAPEEKETKDDGKDDSKDERESKDEESEESKDEPKEDGEGDDEEGGEEDGGEEEEEEEEDDDEPKDPKEELEEECKNSKQCAPAKHHYDECVERVTKQESDDGGAKEDCVEEFFHLAHCATQCAAPKLWSKLK